MGGYIFAVAVMLTAAVAGICFLDWILRNATEALDTKRPPLGNLGDRAASSDGLGNAIEHEDVPNQRPHCGGL